MAGDWLKVEKDTPDKPEIFRLAALLGITQDDAFGKCFRFWRWADSHTVNGLLPGVSKPMVDAVISCAGFADSLEKVGWLKAGNDSLKLPEFGRHTGESAKQRALTAKRVAEHKRKKGNGSTVSDALPREQGEQEETRGEPIASKSNGTTNGIQRPPLASRLPKVSCPGEEEPFDLSGVDWDHVRSMAEAVARKIPPTNEQGRRAWLKYAVLADMSFSEHWLMDSVEAVLQAKGTNSTRQAHFVAVLKAKATADHEVDAATLAGLAKRIEIPSEIWKSPILKDRVRSA